MAYREYVEKGYYFVIITGGGKTCRMYNSSLEKIINPTDEELDWLGIFVTRLNAELIKISFGELAYENILLDPDVVPETEKPGIIMKLLRK